MATDQSTETRTRWERPEGWRGTWADIFEEMGWDPAEVTGIDFGEEAFMDLVVVKQDGEFTFELDDMGYLVAHEWQDWDYDIKRIGAMWMNPEGELIVLPRQDDDTHQWVAQIRGAMAERLKNQTARAKRLLQK